MEIIICNKSKAIKQKESCKGSYQDIFEESRKVIEESRKVVEENRRMMFKNRVIIAKILKKNNLKEYKEFIKEMGMMMQVDKCNTNPKCNNFDLRTLNKDLNNKQKGH